MALSDDIKSKKLRPFVVAALVVGILVVGLELWLSRGNLAPAHSSKAKSPELVHWVHNYSKAIALADKSGRPILIDFYATWCGPCQRMAQDVYADSASADYINTHFVPLQVDLSNGDPVPIARKLSVRALPTLAILTSDGKAVNKQVGYRGKKFVMSWVRKNFDKATSKIKTAQKQGNTNNA